MKSFFKYILFLILLNVGLVAKSETIYPIQLYATMLPPYTNCISDYITDGMHRMKLTAVVRDMNNHSFNQVRVLIQVKMGDKIKYEATTYPAVLGQAKMMHDISVTALNNIIVGDGKEGGCLEEGSYEFVFQVFDAHNSSLPLSEPVSIYCYLDKPEPPVCIYPKDGDCIKDGGVINFTWMDAVASNLSSKEYKFELLEDITPEPSNSDLLPMFGDKDIAGKKGILERTIYNSNVYTLNYAGVLQTGRKYYWRVTNVTDASKANYTNGANKYSELSSFTFGDCNPATPEEVKKEVEELSEKLEIKSVDTDSKSVSATITWGLEGSDDVEALKKFCKYKLYFTRKKNSNESVDATASESNEENQESETDDNKPDEDSNVKSVDDIEDEFVVEVGNVNTYTITSVERTQIYNVRVEGITCDENKEISGKTDKSEPKDFMIPQLESDECNSNIKEVECQSLATLEKGASFFANDDNVVVKVTELDQSKSNDETHVYSGKGIVTCTIFKEKLGLNVEFKNIKVNKDNHLCDGVVEVVSSEENNLMVNLNDVAGKGRTASKAPEQKEVKNVENKEEITDPKKNQEHRNNVVTNGSTLYAVNNTGGSESVGTLVNDVTPSTSSLDNEDGVVLFDVEKNLENNSWTPYIDMGAYPFLNTSIVRDYERMGGSYIVPWLAMESGDFKWIKAKPTLKDNKDIKRFDELNFYAKIGENYYQLDSKKIENGNSFDYNVKVFGADANKSYSIYAMSKDKSKTFGRLKVYSMKNKEIKVKLVPVINKVEFENSLTDFQDRLNKIFEPLAKKFIFKMDEKPFTNDDIKEPIDEQQNLGFLNEGLNTSEGSDIFANETKEMKWLRKLYQKNTSDDNSYDAYLFLIPKNTESEIKGFMPRTYSVGYLFVGEDGKKYDDINTAAHELCHGVFGLQHAFDYEGVVKGGVEENLMDYSTADIFRYPSKYFQWYNIENPSDYHFPFVDTPEDGEAFEIVQMAFLYKLKCAYLSGQKKLFTEHGVTHGCGIRNYKLIDFSELDKYETVSCKESSIKIVDDCNVKKEYFDDFDGYVYHDLEYKKKEEKDKIVLYDFGGIDLIVNKEYKECFEDFFFNKDFSGFVKLVHSYLSNKNFDKAFELLRIAPTCVFELLSYEDRTLIISGLYEKFYLNKGYEEILLKTIESQAYGDPKDANKLYNLFFANDSKYYLHFLEKVDNDKKNSHMEFIIGLSNLAYIGHTCKYGDNCAVKNDGYTNLDNCIKQYFCWNTPSLTYETTIMPTGVYNFYVNQYDCNIGVITPAGAPHIYDYDPTPNSFTNVTFNNVKYLPGVKAGTFRIMPTFLLANLLNDARSERVKALWENIIFVASFAMGVGEFASATTTAQKLYSGVCLTFTAVDKIVTEKWLRESFDLTKDDKYSKEDHEAYYTFAKFMNSVMAYKSLYSLSNALLTGENLKRISTFCDMWTYFTCTKSVTFDEEKRKSKEFKTIDEFVKKFQEAKSFRSRGVVY